MVKICLDPGHGGTDYGALLGKRYEKDDALRLALAVKPLLEAQGVGAKDADLPASFPLSEH